MSSRRVKGVPRQRKLARQKKPVAQFRHVAAADEHITLALPPADASKLKEFAAFASLEPTQLAEFILWEAIRAHSMSSDEKGRYLFCNFIGTLREGVGAGSKR